MANNWKPTTAQLNTRVTVCERVKSKNAAGYTEYTLSEKLSAAASVDTWDGGLKTSDDADTNRRRIRVRIRWRDWIKEGLWVTWGGTAYEITYVDHYDFKNDFLCLECRAEETARA